MDPTKAHFSAIYASAFKGHPYQWMQQGDFRDVVTLTKAKVRDWYTKHYHPSNGQAFCYGPQDFVDECMNLLEPYLSQYEANDINDLWRLVLIYKASDINVLMEHLHSQEYFYSSVAPTVTWTTFLSGQCPGKPTS